MNTTGRANIGKELMVFDWMKAAALIREKDATEASAGLSGDWEYTSVHIFKDGRIVLKTDTYLASTWATPMLKIGDEIVECFKMKSETPGWDSSTYWPLEAVIELERK